MKIQFTDKRISEYKNGDFHAINDGEPIEVNPAIAGEFLAAKHVLDGEFVPVFELVEAEGSSKEQESFTVESLAKMKREKLEKMAKEAGLDGNSYTNKTELATAILAAKESGDAN